jgi:DNA-binding response OmpR family regulator
VSKPFSAELLMERIENQLGKLKDFQFEESEDEEEYEGEEKTEGESRKIGRELCILAVDDSPSMLRSIHYALRNKYKVFTLPDPENVKKILQKTKPDLFLLDYNMPVLNGFELIPIIREFPEHKETPIIFLTAKRTEQHLLSAISLGACDYITKPLNPKTLREKIAKHIKKL